MSDDKSFTAIGGGAYRDQDGVVYKPFRAVGTNIFCDKTQKKIKDGCIAYLTRATAEVYQSRRVIEINMDDFYGDEENSEETPEEGTGDEGEDVGADRAARASASRDAESAEAESYAGVDRVQARSRRTSKRN